MARDYKNARRNSSSSFSGGAGLAVGLLIGLMVAIAVYLHDRHGINSAAGPVAPMSDDVQKHGEKRAPASQTSDPEQPLEFYDMLPKYEVVVPEKDANGKAGGAAPKVERPGVYILQAGSYRNFADADRIRARLALQGVESKIQKVTVDSDTWHRVRIGPINKLAELEETRRKLREAQIDALVIRTGD